MLQADFETQEGKNKMNEIAKQLRREHKEELRQNREEHQQELRTDMAAELRKERETELMEELQEVRQFVTKAKADGGKVHQVFVDSRGNIDMVSVENDGTEAAFIRVSERAGYGKPSFEIVTVAAGELLSPLGGTITDDLMQQAVENAMAERLRFYREREQTYGPEAWAK